MTQTIHLPLVENAYDIHIGSGLLEDKSLLSEKIAGRRIYIISNPTVAELYLPMLQHSLSQFEIDSFLMDDGEQHKTLDTLQNIVADMLSRGHHRGTTVIALGGGVVGDTAGFAAAVYQRGVPFIQVPTTLLAQVDSSVGGKTAVNHPLGKNMIGAFHQPKAVYIDTNTLSSLPARELSAGLAEVIKHGLLADYQYFESIESNIEALLKLDREPLIDAIRGSCLIKTAVVAEDEKESGARALLNFGHTFGHAIETAMGYGQWLHGEAVGAGLVMATDLSLRLGRCSREDALRVKALVAAAGLPVEPPSTISEVQFLELMSKDKKVSEDGLRLVLFRHGIGTAELVTGVPTEKIKETLHAGAGLCQ